MPTTPPIGSIPHAPWQPLPREATVPVEVVGDRVRVIDPAPARGRKIAPSTARSLTFSICGVLIGLAFSVIAWATGDAVWIWIAALIGIPAIVVLGGVGMMLDAFHDGDW